MKTRAPRYLLILNGAYARGKKIQVGSRRPIIEGMRPVFNALRFLERIRRPGEKLVFRCLDISTENGEAVVCETSLIEDFNHTHSNSSPHTKFP